MFSSADNYITMKKTDDVRINNIKAVDPPAHILAELPATEIATETVSDARTQIHQILSAQDDRLLVVVGPCSIHDVGAAKEYADKLFSLSKSLQDDLFIVMRVYFEKPRTRLGWKGLINDPDLNASFDINKGIRLARSLLLDLANMGLPAGSEFLDIVTGQYIADLLCWGAIGARTTESQVHREMASGLSCPVGFKNGTDGSVKIAIDAVFAAREPHIFLSPTKQGHTAIYTTTGNADSHIILRGGSRTNYDAASVAAVEKDLQSANLDTRIMIDLSHANSGKDHLRQIEVGRVVAEQIAAGSRLIMGVMIESHLREGRQDLLADAPLNYGQSITDACLSWSQTEPLLKHLAESVRQRRIRA